MRVEILRGKTPSDTGEALLLAMESAITAAGDKPVRVGRLGRADLLLLYGIGAPSHAAARKIQLARGGRVLHFDLGYFGRKKLTGYLRMCLDRDHPQHLLDRTPTDPERWEAHGIELREDADPQGSIILVGLGRKSRSYLNVGDWERQKLKELRLRFPGRDVIFRPKGDDTQRLGILTDGATPISSLMRGASLVVCRHSNVAVDAAIAGVPFESEDGAAVWLARRPFTPKNRLEFLRRLAHWQYRPDESAQAWAFAKRMMQCSS